jgi:hypothetical protein
MTNKIDTSPARLRAWAKTLPNWGFEGVGKALLALADEKEALAKALHYPDCWDPAAYPTVAETLQEVSHSFKCFEPSEPAPEGKCPTCGSDCNERDELTKAEREIEKLRAEKEAAGTREPVGYATRQGLRRLQTESVAMTVYKAGQVPSRESNAIPLYLATVPWPTVTRYSGDRVWVRLKDDGPEVEYMPVDSVVKPAPVLLTDEECQQLQRGCFFNGWLSGSLYARAIEAAVLKKNGLIS